MSDSTEIKLDKNNNNVSDQGALLGEWKNFANLEEQILSKVTEDLESISGQTAEKTRSLSTYFQDIVKSTAKQSEQFQELMRIAKMVEIGDQSIEIHEISKLLQQTFVNSISCILEMSKQAMVMVYILDDALETLEEIEKSNRAIENINSKTKYLSLNATIEAVRAGEAGESFQVVASEVRDLSSDTQKLAVNIRGQVNQMALTLNRARLILQNVASIDMTDNIMSKEKLDDMMEGLVSNSRRMSDITDQATQVSQRFSQNASEFITNMQFEDRLAQDFQLIKKTLGFLIERSKKLQHYTKNELEVMGISGDNLNSKSDKILLSDEGDDSFKQFLTKAPLSTEGAKEEDITLF